MWYDGSHSYKDIKNGPELVYYYYYLQKHHPKKIYQSLEIKVLKPTIMAGGK